MQGCSRVLPGWATQWDWPREAEGSGGVQICKVGVPRTHTYLAKAVQGLCPRVPAFMDTHGGGKEGVLPLQQHANIAPGQSWVRAREGRVSREQWRQGEHRHGWSQLLCRC